MNIKDIAVEVLTKERMGLQALITAFEIENSSNLPDAFEQAVTLCQNIKGRVILSGMGKSGHIARKISSTLASTGTPSYFVHPGEASHGDLGMISDDDVVIALSNSGNTGELTDLLAYTVRYKIPLIAITSGQHSDLAAAARLTLLLPSVEEACLVTKAPTTSALMTLALGDALAVALLKLRGFTPDDFHKFHPGGKLGAALKRVSFIMRPLDDHMLCRSDTHLSEAVASMDNSSLGCIGIVDRDNKLLGIITDGDLRRHYTSASKGLIVSEVMTRDPIHIGSEKIANEALKLMSDNKITALFVLDDEQKAVGFLHLHDFLDLGVA
ncbi:MAG: KpsF/GutQ family sugar-phosphate isomerase [Maricaulaceae bacterium]